MCRCRFQRMLLTHNVCVSLLLLLTQLRTTATGIICGRCRSQIISSPIAVYRNFARDFLQSYYFFSLILLSELPCWSCARAAVRFKKQFFCSCVLWSGFCEPMKLWLCTPVEQQVVCPAVQLRVKTDKLCLLSNN